MKAVAAYIGAFLMILVLMGGIYGAAYGFSWVVAPWQGKLQARQQINSGNFRIAAYDHFFNICAAVQTDEAAIDALNQELKSTNDPKELTRIGINITGNQVARAGAINQYNVDARKDYTEGQFKDSDLPYQLSTAAYTGSNKTSCGS